MAASAQQHHDYCIRMAVSGWQHQGGSIKMTAQDGSILTESEPQHQDGSVRVAGSAQQYQGGSIKEAGDGSIRTAASLLQHQYNRFRIAMAGWQWQGGIVRMKSSTSGQQHLHSSAMWPIKFSSNFNEIW